MNDSNININSSNNNNRCDHCELYRINILDKSKMQKQNAYPCYIIDKLSI
jgi:hypothetical protein